MFNSLIAAREAGDAALAAKLDRSLNRLVKRGGFANITEAIKQEFRQCVVQYPGGPKRTSEDVTKIVKALTASEKANDAVKITGFTTLQAGMVAVAVAAVAGISFFALKKIEQAWADRVEQKSASTQAVHR